MATTKKSNIIRKIIVLFPHHIKWISSQNKKNYTIRNDSAIIRKLIDEKIKLDY
jgi:hypothetical protein